MIMIPHFAVVVVRDGQNFRPPVGQPYDFTSDEVRHFIAQDHRSLRRPVNEAARMQTREVTSADLEDADADEVEPARPARVAAGAKRPAAGAKRPAAVAEPEEDEL